MKNSTAIKAIMHTVLYYLELEGTSDAIFNLALKIKPKPSDLSPVTQLASQRIHFQASANSIIPFTRHLSTESRKSIVYANRETQM